jgi:hypothetical protein
MGCPRESVQKRHKSTLGQVGHAKGSQAYLHRHLSQRVLSSQTPQGAAERTRQHGQRRVDKVVGEKWNRRIVVMDEDDGRSATVKSRTAQPYLSITCTIMLAHETREFKVLYVRLVHETASKLTAPSRS